MKRDWILPLGFLILLTILIGATGFLPAAAETITGSVDFEPSRLDLQTGFGVAWVEGTIRFPSGKGATVKDINTSTILLEGTLPANSTYLIPGGLVAKFDSQMVEYIIQAKINHMGLTPPYKVWLTITGNLKDSAGGTPFSATGYIKLIVPHSQLPP